MKKNAITKILRDAGVKTLDVAAVNRLFVHVDAEDDPKEALNQFIRAWNHDGDKGDRLTVQSVEATLTQLRGGRQKLEVFSVVNAFNVPKISYDVVGRRLYADNQSRTIFAPAQAKQQLYIDRLNLINQRIRRSSIFQPRVLAGDSSSSGPQLTDIQSLKGILGVRKFVIGCISCSEVGRYLLEDGSGTVPLNLTAAQTAAGFYTENCIVIAEGEMQADGVFHAAALGFPPAEPRESLPMAAQRLNFFGGPSLSAEDEASLAVEEQRHEDDRLVILSNVHLDSREVLASLNTLFTGYNDMEQLPAMFVLMGNFHSRGASSGMPASAALGADMDYAVMRDCFNTLAALIEQFPRIRAESSFVFVPGPGDPSSSTALPQPPLPAYLTHELRRVLPNAIFSSNPCRIRYLAQEIVFFRYDILRRLRRRCLIPPRDPGGWLGSDAPGTQGNEHTAAGATQAARQAMWGHLSLTLLQQSHLCPLPLLQQPIYWQYDHALHLYPLPHALVVADSSPQEQYTHEGCVVFNPGSFSEGSFASYKPCGRDVELNEIPRDGHIPAYEDEEQPQQEHETRAAGGRESSGKDVTQLSAGRDMDRGDVQPGDQDQDDAEAVEQGHEAWRGPEVVAGAQPMEFDDEGSPAAAGSGADEGHDEGSPRASKRHNARGPTDQEMWEAVIQIPDHIPA